MSRTSRIPYHQNVYDLLGIEPGESPEAARKIAEHEAKHGPLPASVREWYLAAHAFERPDPIVPLDGFLNQLAIATVTKDRGRWAYVALGGDSGEGWFVHLDAA